MDFWPYFSKKFYHPEIILQELPKPQVLEKWTALGCSWCLVGISVNGAKFIDSKVLLSNNVDVQGVN